MRSYSLTALFAAATIATPVKRQDFDWDAIEALDPIPTISIPVVDAEAAQTTIAFEPTAAAAAVGSAVLASPSESTINARGVADSAVEDSSQAVCEVPKPSFDSPEYFQNNEDFTRAATSADTPPGYELVYQNQNASSIGVFGYLGYSVLQSYDTQECSSRCDAVTGCQSFNSGCNSDAHVLTLYEADDGPVYFERNPAEEPRANCTDPASTTVIKCAYYGGGVTERSATNDGQYRDDFHVLIAGSNGYVNNSISTPRGYAPGIALGNGAIQAPKDCNGRETYMTVKIFQTGVFSVDKCAAACTAQSEYNRGHPEQDGFFQTCQFFNTYVLYNSSVAVGQYCALYNETWPAAFATNVGQWRGDDFFSLSFSYAFSNSTGNADRPLDCTNPTQPQ